MPATALRRIALGALATTATVAAGPASGTALTAPVAALAPAPVVEPAPVEDPATGSTYYVDDRAGDDRADGTSEATAWATLAKAEAAVLVPGSRLLLRRGGTWTGSLTVDESGTADQPVVVGAYGTGEDPLIRGGRSCVVLKGSHLVLEDVEARDCSWAGVQISGSANVVRRTTVAGNAAGMHVREGAVGNAVLANRIVGNNRMSVLTPKPANDDSGAFGVLLNGDGTEVAYNTISGSDAFSHDYGRDGAAIEVFGARDSHVHHNMAVDNDAFVELGNPRSANNTFAYNVVRSSLDQSVFLVTRGALSSYGPVAGTRAVHNTVLLTGASSQGFVCHKGCSPAILSLRDNVIQGAWKVGYADAPFDDGNGLYFGGRRQFVLGPGSRVADPRFVDPAAGNLRLARSSPGVDAGATAAVEDFDRLPVPVDGDGNGVAVPDVGAYEYR